MKILLLNPPGDRMYNRDNYCFHVSKTDYYTEPTDLLVQSGHLSLLGDVSALDAIVENLSPEECLSRIRGRDYDAILSLTSAVSYRQDLSFLDEVHRALPGAALFASGGYLLFLDDLFLENYPFLRGVLLDYTSADLKRFLGGEPGPFPSLSYREDRRIIRGRINAEKGEFSYPVPRHELFPLEKYSYPYIERRPFSKLITSYGCPSRCGYCPYGPLEYKLRKMENVLEELGRLKELGVKEIFFHDPSFYARRDYYDLLMDRIRGENFLFSWSCETRAGDHDRETIRRMRKAGCHTVNVGVETLTVEALKAARRSPRVEELEKFFRVCRESGMKTLVHIILGLPGDAAAGVRRTVDFLRKSKADYLSVNVLVPVIGSELRRRARERGVIVDEIEEMDNSAARPRFAFGEMTVEEIEEAKRYALRKFYCDPRYIFRRLMGVRTWYQFGLLLRSSSVILSSVRKRYES